MAKNTGNWQTEKNKVYSANSEMHQKIIAVTDSKSIRESDGYEYYLGI